MPGWSAVPAKTDYAGGLCHDHHPERTAIIGTIPREHSTASEAGEADATAAERMVAIPMEPIPCLEGKEVSEEEISCTFVLPTEKTGTAWT